MTRLLRVRVCRSSRLTCSPESTAFSRFCAESLIGGVRMDGHRLRQRRALFPNPVVVETAWEASVDHARSVTGVLRRHFVRLRWLYPIWYLVSGLWLLEGIARAHAAAPTVLSTGSNVRGP